MGQLIALLDDGVPVVGVVSAPALQRRWWAARGAGRVRHVRRWPAASVLGFLSGATGPASLSFSDLAGWADRGVRERFIDLTDAVWRVRAYGDFCSYCLLAEGAVDIAAEPEVKVWDLAPLDIVVREAGGAFTSFDGRPVRTAAVRWRPTGCCTSGARRRRGEPV